MANRGTDAARRAHLTRPELIKAQLSPAISSRLTTPFVVPQGFVLNETVPPIFRAGSRFHTSDIAFVTAE